MAVFSTKSPDGQVSIVRLERDDAQARKSVRGRLNSLRDQFGTIDPRERFVSEDPGPMPPADHYLDDGGYIYLALSRGRAVGYVVVMPPSEESKFRDAANVRILMVDPAERGKGIGRRLLAESVDDVRRMHPEIKRFSLNVLSRNSVAIDLYESEGFEPFSVTMIKELV